MITIHPLAEVATPNIGDFTTIWQFAVVLHGARIGSYCNINCHTFIENNVVLGDYVTVKSGVYLWDGLIAENNVFIGPNVTFVNDRYPRSKQHPGPFQQTLLREGCSIGAGATILGNISIGRFAMIGAGAVVTKDVPDHALFYGNPGKIEGWVNEEGIKLVQNQNGDLEAPDGTRWQLKDNLLKKV